MILPNNMVLYIAHPQAKIVPLKEFLNEKWDYFAIRPKMSEEERSQLISQAQALEGKVFNTEQFAKYAIGRRNVVDYS
jgi:hypothetical protein